MTRGITKEIFVDTYYLSLLLIVLTLPFSIQINTLCITFGVICWLPFLFISDFRKKVIHAFKGNLVAILFIGFALFTALAVIIHLKSYDEYWSMIKTVERRSVYLFAPIILSGMTLLSRPRVKKLLMLFVYLMIITSLICLIMGVIATLKTGTIVYVNPVTTVVGNNFMYHRLGSYIGMHAVFYSAFISLAFFILLIRFLHAIRNSTPVNRVAYYIAFGFMTIMILLLESITIIAIFFLIVLLIILHHVFSFEERKKILKVTIISVLIASPLATVIVLNKLDSERGILDYKYSDRPGTEDSNWNPINIRLAIWSISSKAVKDNWVLGVGPSNMNETLNTYYEKNGFVFGMLDELNPHNQYLHTFLNLGIGGFLILMAIIVRLIVSAVRKKDIILGTLVLLFILFSLTASTLSINKGIVFFTFFFCFLSYLRHSTISYLTIDAH